MRYKNGEGVDQRRPIADPVPDHDDPHRRDPVVTEGQTQGDEDGDEGEVLFAESDRARPDREHGSSTGHQPEGSISPAPDERSHRGVYRAGGTKNGERPADDEDEEDDLVGAAEPPGNGRQARPGRQRRRVRGELEAARHHLKSPGGILHPFERPGGEQVGEHLRQDHHPAENDQRVGDLEPTLRHEPFTYFSNQERKRSSRSF